MINALNPPSEGTQGATTPAQGAAQASAANAVTWDPAVVKASAESAVAKKYPATSTSLQKILKKST